MPVLTTDITIQGMNRDAVLAWLSVPSNHSRLVKGAFAEFKEVSTGEYDLVVKTALRHQGFRYRFERVDDEHGGRRVHVSVIGKRIKGALHYSLRTMKPSTNTMITIHLDYEAGGPVGFLLDAAGLRQALEDGWKKVLENLGTELTAAGAQGVLR